METPPPGNDEYDEFGRRPGGVGDEGPAVGIAPFPFPVPLPDCCAPAAAAAIINPHCTPARNAGLEGSTPPFSGGDPPELAPPENVPSTAAPPLGLSLIHI